MRNSETLDESLDDKFMRRLGEIKAESQEIVMKSFELKELRELSLLLSADAIALAEMAKGEKDKGVKDYQKALSKRLGNIARKQIEEIDKIEVAAKAVSNRIDAVTETVIRETFSYIGANLSSK